MMSLHVIPTFVWIVFFSVFMLSTPTTASPIRIRKRSPATASPLELTPDQKKIICLPGIQNSDYNITDFIIKDNGLFASPRKGRDQIYFVIKHNYDFTEPFVMESFLSKDSLGVDRKGRLIIESKAGRSLTKFTTLFEKNESSLYCASRNQDHFITSFSNRKGEKLNCTCEEFAAEKCNNTSEIKSQLLSDTDFYVGTVRSSTYLCKYPELEEFQWCKTLRKEEDKECPTKTLRKEEDKKCPT